MTVIFLTFGLDPFPLCTVGNIGNFDSLVLEFIADAVGLGKVLGLLGRCTSLEQLLNGSIRLTALGYDGKLRVS